MSPISAETCSSSRILLRATSALLRIDLEPSRASSFQKLSINRTVEMTCWNHRSNQAHLSTKQFISVMRHRHIVRLCQRHGVAELMETFALHETQRHQPPG